jgi:hypothetical protein
MLFRWRVFLAGLFVLLGIGGGLAWGAPNPESPDLYERMGVNQDANPEQFIQAFLAKPQFKTYKHVGAQCPL